MLKLLTLNLHCLEEDNLTRNKQMITNKIIEKDIDIIFLQEVAQYRKNDIILDKIKSSNYGYDLQQRLKKDGKEYYYNYIPIKFSFDKYDEGLGILSKYPFDNTKSLYISKSTDYNNWKSRKVQKADIVVNNKRVSLFNTHLGWTDEFETFEDQVDKMLTLLDDNLTILAGDFNVSPDSKEYKYLINKKLFDVFYSHNPRYLNTPTHNYGMDIHKGENRIDYFFTNRDVTILDREILFNDIKVSDHYGVFVKIKI